jgi:hypothetical protein
MQHQTLHRRPHWELHMEAHKLVKLLIHLTIVYPSGKGNICQTCSCVLEPRLPKPCSSEITTVWENVHRGNTAPCCLLTLSKIMIGQRNQAFAFKKTVYSYPHGRRSMLDVCNTPTPEHFH